MRETVEIGGDHVAAVVLIEDHITRFELRDIIFGIVDRDLPRRQKAMSARRAADRHFAER